jgi:hypothetical protein
MMTPEQRIRSVVDRMAKNRAKRPAMPSGGETRSLAEALNTSANARALAAMNTKIARPSGLAELIRKARQS